MPHPLADYPEDVRETASPSQKFVAYKLESEERPLSVAELADLTGMSASTIRTALEGLRDAGAVERRPDPRDARQNLYELATAEAAGDAVSVG